MQGKHMAVENNTIEAFEVMGGAPQFGIMWHPEADQQNCAFNKRLMKFMADAGNAFAAKRNMLISLPPYDEMRFEFM
jgi:gamma-glutamyl-gamma-aminobutyrate hydrolase PuuD